MEVIGKRLNKYSCSMNKSSCGQGKCDSVVQELQMLQVGGGLDVSRRRIVMCEF